MYKIKNKVYISDYLGLTPACVAGALAVMVRALLGASVGLAIRALGDLVEQELSTKREYLAAMVGGMIGGLTGNLHIGIIGGEIAESLIENYGNENIDYCSISMELISGISLSYIGSKFKIMTNIDEKLHKLIVGGVEEVHSVFIINIKREIKRIGIKTDKGYLVKRYDELEKKESHIIINIDGTSDLVYKINNTNKLTSKLKNLNKDRDKALPHLEDKTIGLLIQANLYQLRKGDTKFTTYNFYGCENNGVFLEKIAYMKEGFCYENSQNTYDRQQFFQRYHGADAVIAFETHLGAGNGRHGAAVSGEGKTTVACNLAVSLGNIGNKVLVVDLDFHRPHTHRLFKVEKENGIAEYMLGNVEIEQVTKKTEYENVEIITRGAEIYNASVILVSNKFKQLIADLKEKYDYVILDCPPVLQVSDFIHIAKISDGVLFLVSYASTTKAQVSEAVEDLEKNGAKRMTTYNDKAIPAMFK